MLLQAHGVFPWSHPYSREIKDFGPLVQLADTTDLKSAQSQFESEAGYRQRKRKKGVVLKSINGVHVKYNYAKSIRDLKRICWRIYWIEGPEYILQTHLNKPKKREDFFYVKNQNGVHGTKVYSEEAMHKCCEKILSGGNITKLFVVREEPIFCFEATDEAVYAKDKEKLDAL